MKEKRSKELFEKCREVIPGGVNSPVRAFRSVGLTPRFIQKGKGSKITDADGNEYIDYVCSWGPMILGHAQESVVRAVSEAAEEGTSFGAPTERELEMAALISEAVPSVEMVRMVNSGTEAVMSAIRLARGFTGRDMILKFEGCYHGHSDGLLVKAGSGALTLGVPDSAGVPADYAKNTLTASFNNHEQVESVIKRYGDNLACVVVEPVAGNMGVVPPEEGFLELLRSLTERYGIILIFDEVITGFRLSYGGAQKVFGIKPDLTTLGKIIGGGMPVGAYGGRRDIMQKIAPSGPVYQAGTLSGNPVALAAGIATLKVLRQNPSIYADLEEKAAEIEKILLKASNRHSIPVCVNRSGSMLCVFFTGRKVTDYATALSSDTKKFSAYFAGMLEEGIYTAPSQFEAMFVSAAHTADDIRKTGEAADRVFSTLK